MHEANNLSAPFRFHSISVLFAAIMLLLAAAACSDATTAPGVGMVQQLPTETAKQPIEGGTIDQTHTAIVGLSVKKGGGAGVCTGTLIAPNLVLTARHCVSDISAQYIDCSQTHFTGKMSTSSIRVTTDTQMDLEDMIYRSSDYGVSEIHVTPGGNRVCGNDMALLILNKNIPSSEATPRKPRLSSNVQRGTDYTAMGYGSTGDSSGATGIRRRLEHREVKAVGKATTHGRTVTETEEFAGSGGTCRGDSGGGAFDDQGRVLGALSRGGGTRNDQCMSSIYTGVYKWRSWIKKTAVEASRQGGYAAPTWAGGAPDSDGDGVFDADDNCPHTKNADQKDADGDGKGNACDDDPDGDGVSGSNDNCPATPNPEQADADDDGTGDACTDDDDGDGIEDHRDNCPKTPNPDQAISATDEGAACSPDDDGDGVDDGRDNCPNTPNAGQQDSDEDGTGDACENDSGRDQNDDGGGSQDGSGEEDQNDGGSDSVGSGSSDNSGGSSEDVIVLPDEGSQAPGSGHACSASTTGSPRPADLAGSLLLALLVVGSTRLTRRR